MTDFRGYCHNWCKAMQYDSLPLVLGYLWLTLNLWTEFLDHHPESWQLVCTVQYSSSRCTDMLHTHNLSFLHSRDSLTLWWPHLRHIPLQPQVRVLPLVDCVTERSVFLGTFMCHCCLADCCTSSNVVEQTSIGHFITTDNLPA